MRAEDPSIQQLEDDVMQAEMEEEFAKQPTGLQKGSHSDLKLAVLYATNRTRVGASLSATPTDGNTLEFGTASVTISTAYGVRTDYLPSASFVTHSTATGASRIVPTPLSNANDFYKALLKDAAEAHPAPKVVVFVHGFNTSFAQALERTALISSELQSSVLPVAYCWPSAGSVRAYSHDEEVVRASTEAFSSFLKGLLRRAPGEIVIISHSMGARIVTSSLADLTREHFDLGKLKGVTFVAADIYTSEFQSKWPLLISSKNVKFSLYSSDSDLALKYSFFKHDAARLGYVDAKLWPPPGATTVDASNVDSILSTFGHAYIENPRLGADIGNWMSTGLDPRARGLLSRTTPGGGTVYFFP